MMRWYVASFIDGDTHLAELAPHAYLVSAHCDGRQFRPLAVLPGAPPDQAQVCPACRSGQPVIHSAARNHEVATPPTKLATIR